MNLNRRKFLGAGLATTAGLVSTPAFAWAKATEQTILLAQARAALDKHGARIPRHDRIGLVDFSLHSRERRFRIIDLENGRVETALHVAHGRGSDPAHSGYVTKLSNRPGSNASSGGSFLTGDHYYGKHGKSGRLYGLDDQNDMAFDRAIVIHGADYVSDNVLHSQGRMGRSLGCFAVKQDAIEMVLNRLGPGRLLYAAG